MRSYESMRAERATRRLKWLLLWLYTLAMLMSVTLGWIIGRVVWYWWHR